MTLVLLVLPSVSLVPVSVKLRPRVAGAVLSTVMAPRLATLPTLPAASIWRTLTVPLV